jgi:uncharacterized protein (DUF433 family)
MTTVDFEPLAVTVPLREEPSGVLRVGQSRVLLELVIHAFQRGATPEAIVQSYDTLSLPDVYAVVSYYLANPAPFDEYLRERDQAADETRRRIESSQPRQENLCDVLLARARAKGLLRDSTRD